MKIRLYSSQGSGAGSSGPRRLRRQAGNVLMVALVISAITGLALLSYLSLISSQSTMTARSQTWNSALPIVEAGIEEALAHITASPEKWDTNGWKWTAGYYWLQRDFGHGSYFVTLSNKSEPVITSRAYVRAPLTSNHISRTVRVTVVTKNAIGPGLGARRRIELNGNKLHVDSFDSSDPAYSDASGSYDAAKRKAGATVASNLGIEDAVSLGNADIFGRVATGIGGSIDVLKNGIVGNLDWHNSGGTGIQSGYSSSDADLPFPPIDAPISGKSPPTVTSGSKYTLMLTNDVYEIGSLKGKISVHGNATLIVRTEFDLDGADAITIAPGGKLNLYVYAATAVFGPGSYNYSGGGKAENLRYYGMPSNTEINFNGNSTFVGVLYAPEAAINMNGGGSGVNFLGSLMADTVRLNGTYRFHYDEGLAKLGSPGYVVTSWNEI
jgi:hypothetical protein